MESIKEDLMNYFSAHPETNSIGEKPTRQSPYIAQISLTDDLRLWVSAFIRYTYYPRDYKIVNNYINTLSVGDIVEYILDYDFVQSVISKETKYYLTTLYDLCEYYIKNYLSKKDYTLGEIIDHFSLIWARDITYYDCGTIPEARKTILPKEFSISRFGSDRVDKEFKYISEICVDYKLVGRDDSGRKTTTNINIDIHLSDLIDKVLQKG